MVYSGISNLFYGVSAFFTSSVVFIVTILVIVGRWKMYEKADEPGWGSLIPLYSEYILFKIAWGNGILFLLMLVPIVNMVVAVILAIKLSKAFGMGTGFAIGLLLLPGIFYPILGFSDAVYGGPEN